MEDDFEGTIRKEWHKEDLKTLTSQIKEHESLLRLKRRWLIDLPLSKIEEKRLEELLPPNDKTMPESLLREDDVSYDDIRTCVETAFGVHKPETEYHCAQEDVQLFKSCDDIKEVFALLDSMTNKGLCLFTMIITGGMTKFEKTNLSMKRTIKEHLVKVILDKNDISIINTKEIFKLLKDGNNFRDSQIILASPSERAYSVAAIKILDALEDFSSRTLNAMHRKVRGIKASIPTIKSSKSKRSSESLIRIIRKECKKMLFNLGKVGEPPEPLAGALGVAELDRKVLLNRPASVDFRKFSPEVESLQNDIVKAISLLNDTERVKFEDLESLQLLLDPNVKLSAKSLRMGVRNLLTEYLFECADLDKVPDCIIQTLDIINSQSPSTCHRKYSSSETHSSPQELMHEEIEREVECLLTISAQGKEILLDWLPEHEFDEDFAHAYIEDFQESDILFTSDNDEEDISQNCKFQSHNNSYDQTESIGETNPSELNLLDSANDSDGCSTLFNESKIKNGESTEGKPNPSGCIPKLEPACSDPLKIVRNINFSSVSHSIDRKSVHDDCKSEETIGCSSTIQTFAFSEFPEEQTNIVHGESMFGNLYLEVQEACDATSMVAYRFVGHVLDEIAKIEDRELYQGDRAYLLNGASISEDSESKEKFINCFSFAWC